MILKEGIILSVRSAEDGFPLYEIRAINDGSMHKNVRALFTSYSQNGYQLGTYSPGTRVVFVTDGRAAYIVGAAGPADVSFKPAEKQSDVSTGGDFIIQKAFGYLKFLYSGLIEIVSGALNVFRMETSGRLFVKTKEIMLNVFEFFKFNIFPDKTTNTVKVDFDTATETNPTGSHYTAKIDKSGTTLEVYNNTTKLKVLEIEFDNQSIKLEISGTSGKSTIKIKNDEVTIEAKKIKLKSPLDPFKETGIVTSMTICPFTGNFHQDTTKNIKVSK